MTSAPPTISVVTPNYNHGHLVEACIRSVAAQDVPVLEQIVIDDGSTDDSRAILARLAVELPALRIIEHQRNQGAIAAILRGTREARGDFIVFLAADDTLPEGSLAPFVEVLKAAPDAVIVTGEIEYILGESGRTVRRRYLDADRPTYLAPDDLVRLYRSAQYVMRGAAAALVRPEPLLRAGMENPALKWHLDSFSMNVVAFRHGLWYVPTVFRRYYFGAGNYGYGVRDWRQQEGVLDAIFRMLADPALADVRPRFRDSSVLAMNNHVVRYLLAHPEHREFLTPNLIANAAKFSAYRLANRIMPRPLLDGLVALRTRRPPA